MNETQVQNVITGLAQQVADLSVQVAVLRAQLATAQENQCTCGMTLAKDVSDQQFTVEDVSE